MRSTPSIQTGKVPEHVGEWYLQAARTKDKNLLDIVFLGLSSGMFLGTYTKQLTPEERKWVQENIPRLHDGPEEYEG